MAYHGSMQNKLFIFLNLPWRLISLYSYIVCILVILPLIVLTNRLEYNPPGFFIDEAIYGFEAYSLIKGNGHSSSGELLPRLFLNPGESIRNHSAYTYFIIPFIYFFGFTEFAIRLTSVFFSVGLLLLIFILMKDKVKKGSLYLLALYWPFIPWVFLLSRIGMEFIATAFFFTLTLLVLNRIYSAKYPSSFSYALLFISIGNLFYIYAAGKVLATGFMAISIGIMLYKKTKIATIVIFMALYMVIYALSIPYMLDKSFFYRIDELKQCQTSAFICFANNIMTHFSPYSYFKKTYLPPDFAVPTHSITDTPLVPIFFAPFLLLGAIVLVKKCFKKDGFCLLVSYSAVLAIIPASLTIRGFDSYRSVSLLPLVVILSIYGFDMCLIWLKKLGRAPMFLFISLSITLMLLEITTITNKLNLYEYQVHAASYSGWQYGYRNIFTYFKEYYQDYDGFRVTPQVAYLPFLYLRFFDPAASYVKIQIGGIDYQSNEKILYAIRPEEVSMNDFVIKKVIYYPNNKDIAFYIGEYKSFIQYN